MCLSVPLNLYYFWYFIHWLKATLAHYMYKWKNHFSEMKGDVGMSHHEKEGNKKMPILRQEIIDNPIPTSLFMYYAAVLLCVGILGVQFEDK